MSEEENRANIESYKFHHIDISKCSQCQELNLLQNVLLSKIVRIGV